MVCNVGIIFADNSIVNSHAPKDEVASCAIRGRLNASKSQTLLENNRDKTRYPEVFFRFSVYVEERAGRVSEPSGPRSIVSSYPRVIRRKRKKEIISGVRTGRKR